MLLLANPNRFGHLARLPRAEEPVQASELATCVHGMAVVTLRAWDGLAAQVLLECHLG